MKKEKKRNIIVLSMIVLSSCVSAQSTGKPSKSYIDTIKTIDSKKETGYGTNVAPISYRTGYSLGNRKVISKQIPKHICKEEGTVVVDVTVDQNGKTISAAPGIKGTTNTAKCLLDQARIAAMNTKWESDSDAPAKQVGKIIYNFSLD
ncbi:hypothetical protein [Flavobacterium panacagri]|uniref:hypothetical protein n=1 Tax=Flavobacterium panacagri TaxID=3034146 RepID=UPI003365372B